VLDLAHNQLDRLNLERLLPAKLQFLDISCNSRLRVDPRQFQSYNSTRRRPVSLVDVSGHSNSTSLIDVTAISPQASTSKRSINNVTPEKQQHLPWRLGFSEAAGCKERLLVSQVRMPSFCAKEALCGLFDGEPSQQAPTSLQEMIPRLLLQERHSKQTQSEYLRYTLLSAQRELRDKAGQKYGVDAALIHITPVDDHDEDAQDDDLEDEIRQLDEDEVCGSGRRMRYLLTAASCGEARAVLCKASGPLQLAKAPSPQYLPRLQAALAQARANKPGASATPVLLPEPNSEQVLLEDDDEFVIVGNRHLWEVLSVAEAVREARAEVNPVLAAKRLQDLAQAYGAEDNLSVQVIRLNKPNNLQNEPPKIPALPPVLERPQEQDTNVTGSRPIGPYQVENQAEAVHVEHHQITKEAHRVANQIKLVMRVYLKVQFELLRVENSNNRDLQVVMELMEMMELDRASPPSEEQLRCWEYMLEQNTQLLFDKELDTISSTRTSSTALRRNGQSRSTPHLGITNPSKSAVQLLTRRFGSARSFETSSNPAGPATTGITGSTSTTTSPTPSSLTGMIGYSGLQLLQQVPLMRSNRRLNGGPNAAYFGSLQRLMPYNLEYDFAVIQERGSNLDSLELDATRMQQYWGVATTEL
ncbi:hypothetical protein QAD02_016484, partial [Eretmocerus hayati]